VILFPGGTVVLTPTDGNRTFLVKTGFDKDGNGTLDAAEVSFVTTVLVVKVAFTPDPVNMQCEEVSVVTAIIEPAEAIAQVEFGLDNEVLAELSPKTATTSPQYLELTGRSNQTGSTKLRAKLKNGGTSFSCAEVAVNIYLLTIERQLDNAGKSYNPISSSNGNTQAAIGHYIILKSRLMLGTNDVSNNASDWSWNIDGVEGDIPDAIKSYTTTVNSGVKVDLAPTDLTSQIINLYWVRGNGNKNLSVACSSDGRNFFAEKSIALFSPTNITLTSTTTTENSTTHGIGVGNIGSPSLYYGRTNGGTTNVGIRWTGIATAPQISNGDGVLATFQLVNTLYMFTDKLNRSRANTSSGQLVLDRKSGSTIPEYGNKITPISNAHSESDSPSIQLLTSMIKASMCNHFENYLMYKPKGLNSIYVPISLMKWHCKGETAFVSGAWSSPTNTSSAVNPSGSPPTTLPEWATFSGALGFQNAANPTAINPISGPAAGQTNLSITGSDFILGPVSITIDGNAATEAKVVGATSITRVTPPGSVGVKGVIVTFADGQKGSLSFTYVP
jgi:hypothetical protein